MVALFALSLMWLYGCQTELIENESNQVQVSGVTVQPAVDRTLAPYVFKTSEPAKASLHGYLLVTDPLFNAPDPDDAIYFVPLVGEEVASIPSFNEGEVPRAEVDERTGEFMFTNIEPGQYAVVVTSAGTRIPARILESENLAIIRVNEEDRGQLIELGYLLFP